MSLREDQARLYQIEISRAIANKSDIGYAIRSVERALGSRLPENDVADIVAREIVKADLYAPARHPMQVDVPNVRIRALPIGWLIAGAIVLFAIYAIRRANRGAAESTPPPPWW